MQNVSGPADAASASRAPAGPPGGARAFEHSAQQRPKVEAGAADEDRRSAARDDVPARRLGRLEVVGDAEGLLGIDEVDTR